MALASPVRVADPSSFGAVAFIETWFPDPRLQDGRPNPVGYEVGSGALVAPRLVLTAAHVVYDAFQGGLTTRVRVTLNGATQDMRPARVDFPREWRFGYDTSTTSPFDFAVIQLDRPVAVAHLRVGPSAGPELDGLTLNVVGYPAVPPGGRLGDLYGTQFNPFGHLPGFARRLFYPVATLGGMSGGPVYEFDGGRVIRGVHTSLVPWSDGGEVGSALRIDGDAKSLIDEWIRDYGS